MERKATECRKSVPARTTNFNKVITMAEIHNRAIESIESVLNLMPRMTTKEMGEYRSILIEVENGLCVARQKLKMFDSIYSMVVDRNKVEESKSRALETAAKANDLSKSFKLALNEIAELNDSEESRLIAVNALGY